MNLADRLATEALPYYKREIHKQYPWLYKQGRALGQQTVSAFKKGSSKAVDAIIGEPAPSDMPPWAEEAIDYTLQPVIQGFKKEVTPFAKKAALIGVSVFSISVLAVFYGGIRFERRKHPKIIS
jgi:hypothetical protein